MKKWVMNALGGSFRAVLVVLILVLGIGSMVALGKLKKPPAQVDRPDPVLRVEVLEAVAKDVPVVVRGLGEARALNEVAVSPEVSGNVVAVHARLEQGEVIPAGELLFQVDPRDYQAARDQAQAQVAQLRTGLARLKQQYGIDQSRLGTLERTRDLARQEFERTRTLLVEDEVGTQSGVDAAEMAYNQTRDGHDLLHQQVALYPARIKEAESGLAAAEAQLRVAEANLARTEIRAEFDARIKEVQVERDQYVRAGTPTLTLSDDSMLEIQVPVDSRDARSWLRFNGEGGQDLAWFGSLEPVECTVRWVEDPQQHRWLGTLSRVVDFDTRNRTVTLAVRVSGENARNGGAGLPLVPGMFCAVEIPGREMQGVCELPLWAVNPRDEVYLAREGRLSIQPVEVLRREGDSVFVSSGLAPGEAVIVTRLVDPAPRTRVEIVSGAAEAAS